VSVVVGEVIPGALGKCGAQPVMADPGGLQEWVVSALKQLYAHSARPNPDGGQSPARALT